MSRAALVVFQKELKEGLRDRRSILAALAATLAGPLLVGVILTIVAGDRITRGLMDVPVSGAERAPGLMQSLRAERIVRVGWRRSARQQPHAGCGRVHERELRAVPE